MPASAVAYSLNWSSDLIFAMSFISIIPLSGLVRSAVEDISAALNQKSETLGRLFVGVFDNLVEFVVSLAPEVA